MQRSAKSSQAKDSWEDQEAAFFGEFKPTSSSSTQTNHREQQRREGFANNSESRFAAASHLGTIAKRGIREVSKRIHESTQSSFGQYPGLERRQNLSKQNAVNRNTPERPSFPNHEPSNHQTAVSRPSNQSYSDMIDSYLPRSVSNMRKHITNMVPSCVVCKALAPNPYIFHPFFTEEKACSHHTDIGRCCACHRFEPLVSNLHDISQEFTDLQDHGRKLCPACTRTIILDSNDAAPLWSSVLTYMDFSLGVFGNVPPDIKTKMERIPIVMAGHNGLNDPSILGSGHGGSHTRGMCIFEYRYHPLGGYLRDHIQTSDNALISILGGLSKGLTSGNVSAVLCLKGLPRDLVASILAHEATHAWLKLNPCFDPNRPIPNKVEEGCCQLMAFLYLCHLDEVGEPMRDCGQRPCDKKLRQYFRYCIETDTSDVYGEGFRLAAAAYAELNSSMPALLDYVAQHRCFPS